MRNDERSGNLRWRAFCDCPRRCAASGKETRVEADPVRCGEARRPGAEILERLPRGATSRLDPGPTLEAVPAGRFEGRSGVGPRPAETRNEGRLPGLLGVRPARE